MAIVRILLFVAAIAGAAQFAIDVNIANHEIPITGQTLAVLVGAMLLPRWEALIGIVAYLAAGAFGLPIYADGSYGLDKLSGNSAGYLWGFLLATLAVSTVRGYKSPMGIISILQGQILGTTIILLCGVGVLALKLGLSSAVEHGLAPYWMGAVVKILIGTILVAILRALVRRS